MLLLRREIERDERVAQIAARKEIGVLVLEIDGIAHAAHIDVRPLPPEEVDDDALPAHHPDARLAGKDRPDHFLPHFGREHRPLLLILGKGDDDLVKQAQALSHRVLVSDGKGIERPRKHTFFHDVLPKKAIFVLP